MPFGLSTYFMEGFARTTRMGYFLLNAIFYIIFDLDMAKVTTCLICAIILT